MTLADLNSNFRSGVEKVLLGDDSGASQGVKEVNGALIGMAYSQSEDSRLTFLQPRLVSNNEHRIAINEYNLRNKFIDDTREIGNLCVEEQGDDIYEATEQMIGKRIEVGTLKATCDLKHENI
jgi:hypothetical protein